MPLHTVKKVSELVPTTAGLIKRASLESNLPTGSRNETLISALELEYMIKVAHTTVDLGDAERVCRAVDLYGLRDEVMSHTETMVKSASIQANGEREIKQEVHTAEDFIESQIMVMNPDIEKVAEACEELWNTYGEYISSDNVKLYSGAGTLVKEAAVLALEHRAKRTGNTEFEKIAQLVDATDCSNLSVEDNRAILSAVRGLEKSAHYTESDVYTDMFMTKAAAVMVNLGHKLVDATNLVKVAEHVGSVLGSDIGLLLKEAHSNKSAIEALPRGELQVIEGLTQ